MGNSCPGSIINMRRSELKVLVEKRKGSTFETLQKFKVSSLNTRQFDKKISRYVRVTITVVEENALQKKATFYTWYGYSWKVDPKDDVVIRVQEGETSAPITDEDDDALYNNCNKYSRHKLKLDHRQYFGSSTGVTTEDQEAMANNQINFEIPREINILLLGQSGVGKSTWINGIANYLNYSTIVEAQQTGLISLIPILFTATDANYQPVIISIGSSENESQEVGQAATQLPRTYSFKMKATTVRIIDTPGIGDPRGNDKDKENFQNILDYIAEIDVLHGICILLKPNEEKLSILLQYCVQQLLTKLHKDAIRNIVFCYTNIRSTNYMPGSTNPLLKVLLEQNGIKVTLTRRNDLDMVLDDDTIYCMDNESIRYLAVKEVRPDLHLGGTVDQYINSWNTSVVESERLMRYLARLQPHQVKNTLSINDARRMILMLTKPLTEISDAIQQTISEIREVKKSMRNSRYVSALSIPTFTLSACCLDGLYQVCTTVKCLKYAGGVLEYKCKVKCNPGDGPPTGTCNKCECDRVHHERISYEIKRNNGVRNENSTAAYAGSKQTTRQEITAHLERLKILQTELESEKKKVLECSAQFARFVKDNAIVPYHNYRNMEEYIRHQIEIMPSDCKFRLRTVLEDYRKVVDILDNELEKANSRVKPLQPCDVKSKIEEIYKLKHSGPILKEIMNVVQAAHSDAFSYMEVPVTPRAGNENRCVIM